MTNNVVKPLNETIIYDNITYPSVHNALAAQVIKTPIFKNKFTNEKLIPQDISRLVSRIGLLDPLPDINEILNKIYETNNINAAERSTADKYSDIPFILKPLINQTPTESITEYAESSETVIENNDNDIENETVSEPAEPESEAEPEVESDKKNKKKKNKHGGLGMGLEAIKSNQSMPHI